jgi:hypothetical protein
MTTSDGVSSSGLYGFKNRIINGAMVIDQRNAGASVTINTGSGAYTLDRWGGFGVTSDGVYTVQQSSTAPTGFKNSLLATVTTADSSIAATEQYVIQQVIEGFNIADLGFGTASASTVTLSFWVRSSLTGTFGGSLRNSAVDRSYPFTYTISSANTFEQKTVTIAGDTSGTWLSTNGEGIRVTFSLGSGSSRIGTAGAWNSNNNTGATGQTNVIATNGATFYITGVQLEKGSTATSFDYRPYGLEYLLCQRYFQYLMLFGGNSSGALGVIRASSSAGASESNMNFQGPIMRTNPTVTAVAGSSNILYGSLLGVAGSSFTYAITATPNSPFTGLVLRFRGGPSLTDGTAYVLWNNGGDLYAKLDAEL